MALTAYQTALLNLIQTPQQAAPLISSAQQTVFINAARQQLAGDGECVRCTGSLTLSGSTQSYALTSIGSFTLTGVGGAIAVRKAFISSSALDIRSWEWFETYYLNSGSTGTPVRCAQQGQGTTGTLFFDPVPTGSGTVKLDIVGLPIPLVDDTTAEAIPYPWTDAIPFYAAWLAFQNLLRQADAEAMLKNYKELVRRGRQETTSTLLPDNSPGGSGARMSADMGPVTLEGPPPQPVQGQVSGRGAMLNMAMPQKQPIQGRISGRGSALDMTPPARQPLQGRISGRGIMLGKAV